ncbi:MAG: insulinase family protein, partial [Calditrichae bacterium]|nr:insulinase family protein [Calditrichia bacterium]
GSKNDPAESTGLAHYLEHLLFKGTDQYSTSEFDKEKPLLDEVVQLYEQHRQETDSLTRRAIYHKIDSLSYTASQYAIAAEYDKMLSVIGARGTNAFTGNDLTCYINDIPANNIRQWLEIESERFRDPVFRGFHTELEVVYEEKNRALDSDRRRQNESLYAGLWPTHPYGTQSTLGTVEHLKNPSIQNVYDYYFTYYVPNNMAICLSGDYDPDSMIVMIDETFGNLERKAVPKWEPPVEQPISEPVIKEVVGPDMESVVIGFRFPGVKSEEAELLLITDWLMMNGVAGIIDLNLKQKQLVIGPYSSADFLTDYSGHFFGGRPREGQSLEEVKDLLLAQVDSLKAGAFPDWLPSAAVKNLKLNEIRGYERNWGRADDFMMAFINQQKWEDVVYKWDFREKITKQDIIDFANKYYGNNYVVVYKKTGENPNKIKIKKPPITPVELNRDKQSTFVKKIEEMEAPNIQPVFIDYDKDLNQLKMKKDIPILYKNNEENDLFSMHYIAELGNNHNKKFGVALEYLTYLGTSKYTPEEFKQELYKLGCSFGAWSSEDRLRVYFSGLNESFDKGFQLFEHLLADAQPNQEALDNLVTDILKKRDDTKLNKRTILFRAMYNYGVYGVKSPYQNILSESELKSLTPDELIDLIRQLTNFEHRILYYGPFSENQLIEKLNQHHYIPDTFAPIPEPVEFTQLPTPRNQVYVCHYDMQQVEIIMLSKSVPYNRENIAVRTLFNEYYGGNMSSVVFQTLRESKALAYSVRSSYRSPSKPEDAHYIYAYIGAQADKSEDALSGLLELLNEMAKSENSFADSKNAIVKKIQTERITKGAILWRYESAKRMGNDKYDIREDVYKQVPNLTMDDVRKFFAQYIKDKKYTFLVLGDTNKLDFNILKKYGAVKQLSLEEVFGY